MKPKKSKKADLENKRPLFFQIGLVISLSFALIAFEWANEDHKEIKGLSLTGESIPDDIVPFTRQKEKLPPAPVVPEFKIVINEPGLVEDIPSFDMGVNPNELVDWKYAEETIDSSDNIPFRRVEEMPTFMGGDLSTFSQYIQSHIKYPPQAIELGLEGRVYTDFVVDEKGNVTDVRILRGVDKILDDAVISELESAPRWKAGKQIGKPVKVSFSMPVIFKLQK